MHQASATWLFFPNVIYSIPITYFRAERSTPAYAQAWDQPILNRHLCVFSLSGKGSHPQEQTWDAELFLGSLNAQRPSTRAGWAVQHGTDKTPQVALCYLCISFIAGLAPVPCHGHFWWPRFTRCFQQHRKAIPAMRSSMRKQRPEERGQNCSPQADM